MAQMLFHAPSKTASRLSPRKGGSSFASCPGRHTCLWCIWSRWHIADISRRPQFGKSGLRQTGGNTRALAPLFADGKWPKLPHSALSVSVAAGPTLLIHLMTPR